MSILRMPLSIPTPRPPKTLSSSKTLSSFNPLLPPLTLKTTTKTTPIRMGGGPRTYPGGVSKWQWKRMQAKKAKQLLRARLARERQIYEMRKRAELKAAVSELERPWEAVEKPPNLFSVSADEQVKVLADRFQKPGGLDLWSDRDGPELFSRPDNGLPSMRFFPKGVVHSVRPYGGKEGGGGGEIGGKVDALGSRSFGSVGEMEKGSGDCDEFGGVIGGNDGGGGIGEKVGALWSRRLGIAEGCGNVEGESGQCDEFGGEAGLRRNAVYGRGGDEVSGYGRIEKQSGGECGELYGGLIGGDGGEMGLRGKEGCDNGRKVGALGPRKLGSVECNAEAERRGGEYEEFDRLVGRNGGKKGSWRSGLYGEGEKVGALGSRSRFLSKEVGQKNGVCEGFESSRFEDQLGRELIGRSDGKMGLQRKGGSDRGEKPSALRSRSSGAVVRDGERGDFHKMKVGRRGSRRNYSSDSEGMSSKDVGSYSRNDGRNHRLCNTVGELRGRKSFEEGSLNSKVLDMSLRSDESYGFELEN